MFVTEEPEHDEHTTTTTATVVGTDTATDQGTEVDDSGTNEETGNDTNTEETETSDKNETNDSTTTFSRTYVEKLRRENAGYRERANRADELASRLHNALVAATGRLQDATDLPFDAAHLDDENALTTAIDELLSKKPHLASRQLSGDIGQGNRGQSSAASVNLAELLRSRA